MNSPHERKFTGGLFVTVTVNTVRSGAEPDPL